MYRGPEPASGATGDLRAAPLPQPWVFRRPEASPPERPAGGHTWARSSGMPECYQQGPTLLSGTGNSPGARTAPTGCSRVDRHRMRGWREVHPDTMISVS